MEQLCWKCKKTNSIDCEWFNDCSKYPEYVKVKYGVIVECKNFEREQINKKNSILGKEKSVQILSSVFNKSRRTIYRRYDWFLSEYRKLKDKEIEL